MINYLEFFEVCVCSFMEAGCFTQQVFGQTFVELRYNQPDNQLMVFLLKKDMSIRHFVYYRMLQNLKKVMSTLGTVS